MRPGPSLYPTVWMVKLGRREVLLGNGLPPNTYQVVAGMNLMPPTRGFYLPAELPQEVPA